MARSNVTRTVIKAPRLEPGDTIGIVSPAGPLNSTRLERLERGIDYLRTQGFQVIEGQHVRERTGYLAGHDNARAQDLNDMLNNPAVRAVFCSRGGYGISRLVANIDYAAIRRDPKIIMGYSDVTALSLALYAQTGLVTFAGPMVAVELCDVNELTAHSLWQILGGEMPTLYSEQGGQSWQSIVPGTSEGTLLGGCMSVLSPIVGTPYSPDFSHAILLLEDIGEDLYKIDRLFSHLKHAGILNQVSGIVLGQFVDLIPDSNDNPVEFEDIISYYCTPLQIPVLSNFPHGHVPIKYTLPIGCRVKLDADAGTLQILEPGVT